MPSNNLSHGSTTMSSPSQRIATQRELNYRINYRKIENFRVTFASGYLAGIFCAIISHPADTIVSKLNNMKTEGFYHLY